MAIAIDGTGSAASGASSVTLSTSLANDEIILIVGGVHTGTAGTGITVSSSPSLTWTLRGYANDGASREVQIWSAPSSAILSSAVISYSSLSWTFTGSAAFGVSGANQTTPFDPNASLPASAHGTTVTPTVTGVSTNNANDMIVAAVVGSGSGPPTAATGFTRVWNAGATAPVVAGEYEVVSSVLSSASITFPVSGTASWAIVAIALQAAAGGSNNGSLSETFGDFTLAGTGTLPAHGSLSETFGDFTLAGSGTLPAHGSLSETFGDFTLTGTGTISNNGSLSETFGDFTLAATGTLPAHGSLAETIGDFTLEGTGSNLAPRPVFLLGPAVRRQIPPFGGGLAGGGILEKSGVGMWLLLFVALIAMLILWGNK